MDNETIKSMLKANNLDISDDQVNFLKNKETFNYINNQIKSNPYIQENVKNYNNNNNRNNDNIIDNKIDNNNNNKINRSTNKEDTNIPNNNPNLLKDFNFPKNFDMNSIMEFISKNPNILNNMGPQFSNMFGPNNNNSQNLIRVINTITYLISLPQKIKSFIKSTKGIIIISLILVLIISYIFN